MLNIILQPFQSSGARAALLIMVLAALVALAGCAETRENELSESVDYAYEDIVRGWVSRDKSKFAVRILAPDWETALQKKNLLQENVEELNGLDNIENIVSSIGLTYVENLEGSTYANFFDIDVLPQIFVLDTEGIVLRTIGVEEVADFFKNHTDRVN